MNTFLYGTITGVLSMTAAVYLAEGHATLCGFLAGLALPLLLTFALIGSRARMETTGRLLVYFASGRRPAQPVTISSPAAAVSPERAVSPHMATVAVALESLGASRKVARQAAAAAARELPEADLNAVLAQAIRFTREGVAA